MDPVTLWILFVIYLAWRFLDDLRNLVAHKLAPVTRALGDRATSTGRTTLGSQLRGAADRMAGRPSPGTPRTASGVRLRDRLRGWLRAAGQAATGGRRRSWARQPQPAWRDATADGGGRGRGGGGGGYGGGDSSGSSGHGRRTVRGWAQRVWSWIDRLRDRKRHGQPWKSLEPITVPAIDAPPAARETTTPPTPPPWWLPLIAAQALAAARVAWADAAAAARTAQAKAKARRSAEAGRTTNRRRGQKARLSERLRRGRWRPVWLAWPTWPTTGDAEDPATVYATSERVTELNAPATDDAARPMWFWDGVTAPPMASLPDPGVVDAEIVHPPTASNTDPAPITAAPAAALTASPEGTTTMDNTAAPDAAQAGLSGFIQHSDAMSGQCTNAANAVHAAIADVTAAIGSAQQTLNGIIADEYAGVPVSAYQNALSALQTAAEGQESSRVAFLAAADQFGNANTVFTQIKTKLAAAHDALESDGTTASSVASIRN